MYPPDPRRSHRRLAISEPGFPTARHIDQIALGLLKPRGTTTCRITGMRTDLFLTRDDLERTLPVHFVTLLRGARCQGCGSTVDLARDWLGIAWRDENGRHSCA